MPPIEGYCQRCRQHGILNSRQLCNYCDLTIDQLRCEDQGYQRGWHHGWFAGLLWGIVLPIILYLAFRSK